MINLTDTAKIYFNNILKTNPTQYILLSVNDKGCGGKSYDVKITDEEISNIDHIIDLEHGKLVIEGKSILFLIGITVNWENDGINKKLTFDNPNASGTCGCGESFVC